MTISKQTIAVEVQALKEVEEAAQVYKKQFSVITTRRVAIQLWMLQQASNSNFSVEEEKEAQVHSFADRKN